MRVRNERDRRESARVRATRGSSLIIGRKTIGNHQTYTRENWRDHKDVTTFYFTRFPEGATTEDLWLHFKQSGDVCEVFIPERRNSQGRRYGFVRFKGVRDTQQLQKKLDNMVFRGLKINVNVPKYGRAKSGESSTTKGVRTEVTYPQKGKRVVYLSKIPGDKEGVQRRSYAEVVSRHIPRPK